MRVAPHSIAASVFAIPCEVVVAVEAGFGLRLEHIAQRLHSRRHVARQHVAGRVHDVHGLRAVGLHQLALLGQALGIVEVGHHQEARGIHAELARVGDVLRTGVRLGAVRRHMHAAHAVVIGALQILHRAQARNEQGGDNRLFHFRDYCIPVFLVAVQCKAVLQGVSAEARAVRDLDDGHPCVV